MEMTLKKTLELARKGVITDERRFSEIITELFKLPLSRLESATKYFSFVRGITFENMHENFFDTFTFWDIAHLPQEFRRIDEPKDAYLFLQYIDCGLLDASYIPQVKSFVFVSAESLAKAAGKGLYKDLVELSKKHLDFEITPQVSIGDLLKKIRTVISSPWKVTTDIESYRDTILGVTSIIDIVLESASRIELN